MRIRPINLGDNSECSVEWNGRTGAPYAAYLSIVHVAAQELESKVEQPKQGLAGVNPVSVYAADLGMRNKLITCSSTTTTERVYTPPTFIKFRCLEVSLITASRLSNREVS